MCQLQVVLLLLFVFPEVVFHDGLTFKARYPLGEARDPHAGAVADACPYGEKV